MSDETLAKDNERKYLLVMKRRGFAQKVLSAQSALADD